jgi:hypothetical protein
MSPNLKSVCPKKSRSRDIKIVVFGCPQLYNSNHCLRHQRHHSLISYSRNMPAARSSSKPCPHHVPFPAASPNRKSPHANQDEVEIIILSSDDEQRVTIKKKKPPRERGKAKKPLIPLGEVVDISSDDETQYSTIAGLQKQLKKLQDVRVHRHLEKPPLTRARQTFIGEYEIETGEHQVRTGACTNPSREHVGSPRNYRAKSYAETREGRTCLGALTSVPVSPNHSDIP